MEKQMTMDVESHGQSKPANYTVASNPSNTNRIDINCTCHSPPLN